jgi:peptide/nickel transport system ATP-binding protein
MSRMRLAWNASGARANGLPGSLRLAQPTPQGRRPGRAGPDRQGAEPVEALARAHELLHLVGLDPRAADRYAHEFSGGQRQRIGIACALALDRSSWSPTSRSLRSTSRFRRRSSPCLPIGERFNLTMLFITHDLRVTAQVCDAIAVMRQGEIVESGTIREIFGDPKHPHTRELIDAVPGRSWVVPTQLAKAGEPAASHSVAAPDAITAARAGR